ncbi:MAG: 16S rRNA (guanine(966)-N(2))-methyltransferase RsmD [Oscillospiraceae bacterium]|nr:16S rRNA (guanine(966)-N(2))-methyltransferase RsmD [Oscillospiraceae bacterium]
MRIIAGKACGTVLFSLEGEETRPTLDRVKENFFNAINFELAGARVLDLFAGVGQFGLEALSRGAREAVFVDSNPECAEIIIKNAQKTKLYDRCAVFKCDYADYLSKLKKQSDFEKFDIIFIDPPYKSGKRQIGHCVKKILKDELISNGGLIVCETAEGQQPDLSSEGETAEKIKKSRVYKYGKIYITILTIETAPRGEGDE